MAIAAAGATPEPLAADDAWFSVTAGQAECVVNTIHQRYRPDWRPFLLQLERHLETAPEGSGTLLSFEIPDGGKKHSVLLIISVNAPRHRLAFLTDDERVMLEVRELCQSFGCF
jgi:hypothetical protein